MKKLSRTLLLAAALLFCASAAAQDLKPARDKASKKFGYQAKDKSWIIEPAFDKAQKFQDGRAVVTVDGLEGLIDETGAWLLPPEYNDIGKYDKQGLCEVMVKDGKTKYYGVADTRGRLVLPPDCTGLSYSRSEGLISARRSAPDGSGYHWGVYDYSGNQIFAPQFSSAPSFSKGAGVARSSYTGLQGLISTDGEVLLPFEYMAISSGSGTREALASDFTVESYDSRMVKTGELRSPGGIIPYATGSDPVRIAAWHSGCIGVRLHSNNLYAANVTKDASGRIAICNDPGLNWGYGRFVRLEPELDSDPHPGSMENPYTSESYTLRALMYEADGSFVAVVSDWGWLEGEFDGGYIYNAEGEDTWLISDGPNAPALRPGSTVKLRSFQPVDHSSVISGLLLGNSDLSRLENSSNLVRRIQDIMEGENVGVTSYLPRPEGDWRTRKQLDAAMSHPMFRHPFRMGEVVNCELSKKGEEVEVKLSGNLVCKFRDRFDYPSFSMEGEEEIYWGPYGRRVVWLSLEETDRGGKSLENDVQPDSKPLKLVITLHEEDGTYVRTLAETPGPDFITDELIVFEESGIALINSREPSRPGQIRNDQPRPDRVRIPEADRLPRQLSALNSRGAGQWQSGGRR